MRNVLTVTPEAGSGHLTCSVVLVSILFFVLQGCRDQPSDRRSDDSTPAADTFSVAFYNVENLFDNEFDGHEYVEYRPNATNWNREMHRRKLENIGSVCAAFNADILALCEVEDRDALAQLRQVLDKSGCKYNYHAIIDTPAAASNTHPALLSRYPIKHCRVHRVILPAAGKTRGILEADIDVNGTALKLFVNHWPSKHHPESYRMAAAARLVDRLRELPAGTDYLIVGDFNSDFDEFATFTTFGHNDTRGRTGINHLLGTVRRMPGGAQRSISEREMLSGVYPSHYDLWLELPSQSRMSYFYRGNLQTPDHILLPPSLYDSSGISYIDNSFSAFTRGGKLLAGGKPIRWKLRYSGGKKYHVGEGYSDHLPVVARFSVTPFAFAETDSLTEVEPGKDSAAGAGWFEYHSNGWVADDNRVKIARDTSGPANGRYLLHITAPPLRRNCTVARTVVPVEAYGNNRNFVLMLRGTGKVCLRTRSLGSKKWRYHSLLSGKISGAAKYEAVRLDAWRQVSVPHPESKRLPLEIELRSGKEAALDFSIDR
jgi:endonuclease/exonuclease/phosphatase family metal-dependent hydrolase